MKIGIVSPFNPSSVKDYLGSCDLPFIHNSATSVNTLVLSLLQEGHSLKVFTTCPLSNRVVCLKGERIEVFLIPTMLFPKIAPGFTHHLFLDSFYLPQRIAKVINNEINSLDILHAHWTYEFAVAASKFVGQKPVFVTVRDWAPYILSIQNSLIDRLSWLLRYRLFKEVMNESRLNIIANSRYTFNCVTKAYPNKDVEIIPNPIDKSLILNERVISAKKHSFISIAQLLDDKRKNINTLIDAFYEYRQIYNDAELHLVGGINKDGDLYKQWIKNNRLRGVTFHGNLPHKQMMRLMDTMFCLIHPSLEETFGNILLEAMARKVPCIGGIASGAVPDVLGNGTYGILCDITSSQSICQAMCMTEDELKMAPITEAASSMLMEKYSSDKVAKTHVSIYKKVLV